MTLLVEEVALSQRPPRPTGLNEVVMVNGLVKASLESVREHHPLSELTTREGMRVSCYAMPIDRVPADFFADPDGRWTYEGLARAAGFGKNGVAVGALKHDFNGHPEGAAVVTLNSE